MKIISKNQLQHTQLQGKSTGEIYSRSQVVSDLLGSKQLFAHHDIIAPGRRSSGEHRHSIIEEIIFIVKGTATVVCRGNETVVGEGSFVLFEPTEKDLHYLVNKTDSEIETLTFSISSKTDVTIF